MEFHKPRFKKKSYGGSRSDRGSSYGRSRGSRFSRGSENSRRLETTTVTCGDCGDECQIPFKPRDNRPVYCRECFKDHKPQESGRGSRFNRDSSYGRKERSSRYDQGTSRFQRDRNPIHKRDNFGSKQDAPNREKPYRKNSFDNDSNSFYSTLRNKLFSVLGEKKCVNCGFEDERALGFEQTDDVSSFDYIQRAGAASSWEKYVSDPELAKKELQVICLNCNMIKQQALD